MDAAVWIATLQLFGAFTILFIILVQQGRQRLEHNRERRELRQIIQRQCAWMVAKEKPEAVAEVAAAEKLEDREVEEEPKRKPKRDYSRVD